MRWPPRFPTPLPYRPRQHLTNLGAPTGSWRYANVRSAHPRTRGDHPFARSERLAAVEALLFAAPEPLSAKRIANLAKLENTDEARRLVMQLQTLLADSGSALDLVELAGGYQVQTRPEAHAWATRVRPGGTEVKLSSAAREVLAIIAYRQPIGRADIEAVRGVNCLELLKQLMDKNLVRIVGRDKSLGRPVLYGTTKAFLAWVGLKHLSELPPLESLAKP